MCGVNALNALQKFIADNDQLSDKILIKLIFYWNPKINICINTSRTQPDTGTADTGSQTKSISICTFIYSDGKLTNLLVSSTFRLNGCLFFFAPTIQHKHKQNIYIFFFTENKKHPNQNKLTLLYGFDSFENRIYFTFIARSFFAIHFAWNGLGHVQHWNTPAKIRKNYCFCLRAQACTLGLISKYVCVFFLT